jgi:hypothetical protein
MKWKDLTEVHRQSFITAMNRCCHELSSKDFSYLIYSSVIFFSSYDLSVSVSISISLFPLAFHRLGGMQVKWSQLSDFHAPFDKFVIKQSERFHPHSLAMLLNG